MVWEKGGLQKGRGLVVAAIRVMGKKKTDIDGKKVGGRLGEKWDQ